MCISTLPNEILDLTFKELVPPFRSEALTEIHVFDIPVDLLRLRLVSKRFCRIATPLAWSRVQLRISGEDVVEMAKAMKRRSWSALAPTSTSQIRTMGACSTQCEGIPEEPINHPSSCISSYTCSSNGNSKSSFYSTTPLAQYLFFRAHPDLAAHVRVLSLIISVEHQSEGSGSGSGSASAPGSGISLIYNDEDEESELESGLENHHRRNATPQPSSSFSSSILMASPITTFTPSRRYLEYVLRAATNGMCSLRTVFVWDASTAVSASTSTSNPSSDSNPGTFSITTSGTIVHEVMSLFHRSRLMKVLSLRDIDGAAFSAMTVAEDREYCQGPQAVLNARPHGLKMLHLSNTLYPARVITSVAAAGSLEVLSLEVAYPCSCNDNDNNGNFVMVDDSPTLRDMPWSTLKEVSLLHCVDDGNWYHFLSGFRLYQSHNLQITLTELLIGDLSGLEHNRLTQLLQTFSGQQLTKLTLFNLPHLDPLITSRIVHSFPSLRRLTLLTEGELVPWQGVLDDYARQFALLPRLEMLGWNNFNLSSSARSSEVNTMDFFTLREDCLVTLYTRSVNALVKRAKRLKCVKFFSATDHVVDSVFVGKNSRFRRGSPDSDCQRLSLTVKRSYEAALHTSSWDTTSIRFDDV